ncbi:MAG: multicopper oxidase domain-containing protein [Actinomycetota bacterium]
MDHRKRALEVVVALSVLTLLIASCSGTDGRAGEPSIVHVSLGDFTITAIGEAKAGPVRLHVQNDGKVPHAMAIDVAGRTYSTRELGTSSYDTIDIRSLRAGTYTLWCTIAGHRGAGMESTLTVTEAAKSPVATQTGAMTSAEIDRAHEAGIKAFPAKTQGVGGRVLQPTLVDGFKVFDVTAKAIRWEVSPGQFVDAFAYNAQIPGPEIRVRKGDKVRVVLHNLLEESTSVHLHGVTLPNAMDGVPYITQPPVQPGHSFTYEFTVVDEPGTHMYHSHHNATIQVGKGLLGALIVEPERKDWDVEQTMVLGDGPLGYTINGKGFPATAPIVANKGQDILVRFMNEGQLLHPMHLHGFHFKVIAADGFPVPMPFYRDTLTIAPGERFDVLFKADNPGVWAFHCHVLSHAESEHGMHGMVTAVVVQ